MLHQPQSCTDRHRSNVASATDRWCCINHRAVQTDAGDVASTTELHRQTQVMLHKPRSCTDRHRSNVASATDRWCCISHRQVMLHQPQSCADRSRWHCSNQTYTDRHRWCCINRKAVQTDSGYAAPTTEIHRHKWCCMNHRSVQTSADDVVSTTELHRQMQVTMHQPQSYTDRCRWQCIKHRATQLDAGDTASTTAVQTNADVAPTNELYRQTQVTLQQPELHRWMQVILHQPQSCTDRHRWHMDPGDVAPTTELPRQTQVTLHQPQSYTDVCRRRCIDCRAAQTDGCALPEILNGFTCFPFNPFSTWKRKTKFCSNPLLRPHIFFGMQQSTSIIISNNFWKCWVISDQ